MARGFLFVGLVAAVALIGGAGCGGSSSSTPAPTPNLTFSVDLASTYSKFVAVNEGTTQVGLNDLTGTTTISGDSTQIEVQTSVNFTNGSGPFTGFMTIGFPSQSLLTMQFQGQATYNSTTKTTTLTAQMAPVGGTGPANDAKASGSFTGSMTSVGGPMHLNVLAYDP